MQSEGLPIQKELSASTETARRIAFLLSRAEVALGIRGHGPLHDRLEAALEAGAHAPAAITPAIFGALYRLRGKQ